MPKPLTLLMAALALCLVGCGKRPPVVVPDPPPPVEETGRPSSPIGLDLLIRVQDGRFLRGGQPHAIIGAIPCWPTDGTGDILKVDGRPIPYLWPLVSPEWIEHAAQHGANAFHVRTLVDAANLCCGLEPVGGPRAADGTDNGKFWDTFHVGARAAVKAKATLEVDVLDGWVWKRAIWGDVRIPIPDAQSIGAVPLNEHVKRWVRKVVYESCNYGNVLYQVGNESGLAPGWTPEWERAMHAYIREAEQQEGCREIVHVIGSNSRDHSGPYDYLVSHEPGEPLEPTGGRPMVINEYNPSLPPATIGARAAEAREKGQGFYYWRSDGSDERQDQSLDALSGQAVTACPAPLPDRSKLDFWIDCSRQNSCDATPFVKGDHEFCVAIGMAEMGGQPRYNCPARNEGDPNRLVCEQYLLQRWAPLWRSDGEVTLVDAAGFRARTTGTWLEACDATAEHCKRVTP